jgi:outer membrane biosynthesis protein TonB
MSYGRRIQLAAAVSILLHLVALIGYAALPERPGIGPAPEPEPFVVDLRQEDKRPPRELVESTQAATEPVQETNNIAEQASNARDKNPREAEELGPSFEQEAPHDFLAPPPVPPTPVAPPVEQAPVKPQEVKEETEEQPKQEVMEQEESFTVAEEPEPEPEPEEALPERMQVAQATPPPPEPPQPRPSRGRQNRGVQQMGMSSFEALQDELAPYLKHIRDRVERRWFELLLGRYSGTQPTYVEVDVSIKPDGTLEHVRLVGEPEDKIFGGVCVEAIKRAGPFNPFPFSVPDIYLERNLQIRYSFSFL